MQCGVLMLPLSSETYTPRHDLIIEISVHECVLFSFWFQYKQIIRHLVEMERIFLQLVFL